MTEPHPPAGGELDNETRRQVFLALVNAEGVLTPSAVADRVNTSRELAYHHLSVLVDMGLVTRSNGEYRPQPVFTDPSFQAEFVGVLADLVPEIADRVVLPEDADPEAAEAGVFNCLKMTLAMNMMQPGGSDRE